MLHIVLRLSTQRGDFLAYEWQVSCVYILVVQEEDILEHSNGKYHLCTLVNMLDHYVT